MTFGRFNVLDVVWATSKFREEILKTFEAFLAALKDSIAFINKNKIQRCKIYIEMQGKSYSEKQIVDILNATNQGIPDVEFTVDPKRITKYSDFLHKTGRLPVRPASWKDMFFPNAHDLGGS
jgi:NitT/TauT family transport system substrate-binding protein